MVRIVAMIVHAMARIKSAHRKPVTVHAPVAGAAQSAMSNARQDTGVLVASSTASVTSAIR